MSTETERVLIDALRLDSSARAFIAETLIESLDPDDEVPVSAAPADPASRHRSGGVTHCQALCALEQRAGAPPVVSQPQQLRLPAPGSSPCDC